MSNLFTRLERLEAEHGRAGSLDAVMASLTDEELQRSIAFLRQRHTELAATEVPAFDPRELTGADLQGIVAEARAWAGDAC